MDKKQNVNSELNGYNAKIISLEFKHLEESLFSQYQMLDAQSSRADRYDDQIKKKYLSSLAEKMFELWGSISECADEYDFLELEEEV